MNAASRSWPRPTNNCSSERSEAEQTPIPTTTSGSTPDARRPAVLRFGDLACATLKFLACIYTFSEGDSRSQLLLRRFLAETGRGQGCLAQHRRVMGIFLRAGFIQLRNGGVTSPARIVRHSGDQGYALFHDA